jgi:hypothetical protein
MTTHTIHSFIYILSLSSIHSVIPVIVDPSGAREQK